MPLDLMGCEENCWDLEWIPPNSTVVTLMATSTNDCEATDSVNIEVIKKRKVYIPNAFSPNGDGVNDYFTIFGAIPNVHRIEKLIVFDRWGGVVFEKHDFLPNELLNGWDGTFKGKQLSNGVFAYLAEIRFLDDEIVRYTGDISLIK